MKFGYVCRCGWQLPRKAKTREQYAAAKRDHANGVGGVGCRFMQDELRRSQTHLKKVLALILILGSFSGSAFSQHYIVPPKPKADMFSEQPRSALKLSRWHLDKEIKIMAGIQGGAELVDGISTWKFSHQGLYFPESDPVARFFIGDKPGSPGGIARMAGFGLAENLGAAYLSQHLRHSRHKIFRVVSYGVQPAFAGLHLYAGVRNFRTDYSLCNPGDHYNGSACVPNR